MTASFPIFGRDNKGFAALTLVAHDDASVQTARRALLTAIGRAENRGMGWNADRTTVEDRWGEGPVQAEGIPARVSIERSHPSRVFALDERGRRKGEIQSTTRDGRLEFEIGPDQRTVWYEVTADTGGADSQRIARPAQQARFTE